MQNCSKCQSNKLHQPHLQKTRKDWKTTMPIINPNKSFLLLVLTKPRKSEAPGLKTNRVGGTPEGITILFELGRISERYGDDLWWFRCPFLEELSNQCRYKEGQPSTHQETETDATQFCTNTSHDSPRAGGVKPWREESCHGRIASIVGVRSWQRRHGALRLIPKRRFAQNKLEHTWKWGSPG